jgi:ubiquitin-conjugating enzyme E2 J2
VWASPEPENIRKWHYVLEGEKDSDFAGGMYHGLVEFPTQYPFSPPSILMYTPNGRFQPGAHICLSISSFHPESWNPAWGFSSIILGLQSFFYSNENATGVTNHSSTSRKHLAKQSMVYNLKNSKFREMFPELVEQYEKGNLGREDKKRGRDGEGSQVEKQRDGEHGRSKMAKPEVVVDNDGSSRLIHAARKGLLEEVRNCLSRGDDVTETNINGLNALMEASKMGHVEVVRELLRYTVDVNAVDGSRKTALLRAARKNAPEVVQALLDAGSDPDHQDLDGLTALMIAARHNRVSNILILLERGADPDMVDMQGSRASLHAERNNAWEAAGTIKNYNKTKNQKEVCETVDLTLD